jgi:hypothetical protein
VIASHLLDSARIVVSDAVRTLDNILDSSDASDEFVVHVERA